MWQMIATQETPLSYNEKAFLDCNNYGCHGQDGTKDNFDFSGTHCCVSLYNEGISHSVSDTINAGKNALQWLETSSDTNDYDIIRTRRVQALLVLPL
jgi:hypothetical protein